MSEVNRTTYTQDIKQLGVPRYYNERVAVRRQAMLHLPHQDNLLFLELYAGQGSMREAVYTKPNIRFITVDSDKDANVDHHMKAMDFIETKLPDFNQKIDLVDFDAYGGPQFEIQKYFEVRGAKDAPFVVVVTDGLGLGMKRSSKVMRIADRYLITPEEVDFKRSWNYMDLMTNNLMQKMADKHGLQLEPISFLMGKGKNFFFSAWKFDF